jgi:hypothetical protein
MSSPGPQQTFNPYSAPKARVEDQGIAAGEAPFFAVGTTKLLVMSTVTFGLYLVFWHYWQWKAVRALDEGGVHPVVGAIFYGITGYWLFKRMRAYAQSIDPALSLAAGALAVGILVLGFLYSLPDPWWLIVLVQGFLHVPVQEMANRVNAHVAPEADRNTRFSGWNIAGIVFGVLWFALMLIGMSLPDPA